MTRYFSILGLFVAVYVASQLVPQADGSWFYAVQGLWSLGLIVAILSFSQSTLAVRICGLEYLHIINHLIGCFGYLIGLESIYLVYPLILVTINIIEGLILAFGAPWNGILSRLFLLGGSSNSRGTARYRSIQNPFHAGAKNP